MQWGSCDPLGIPNSTVSCGFFEIPLDYHDPSVGNGRIAVVKANATGTRQGTFFYNPGTSLPRCTTIRHAQEIPFG